MTDPGHTEVAELLGAYALDAVDPDEAEMVWAHLPHCPQCTSELASLREVIALVANEGGNAPAHVWDAISAQIVRPATSGDEPSRAVPATAPPLVDREPTALGATRTSRRRRRIPGWAVGAAAAALILIGVLTSQVVGLNNRVDQLQSPTSSQQAVTRAAQRALSDPAARRIRLDATQSRRPGVAQVAVLPSGQAYLVNRALPSLPSSETYQLWGKVGGELVSLGVLGTAPKDVAFHVGPAPTVSTFAVTVERAGGVAQPSQPPVAVGSVSPT